MAAPGDRLEKAKKRMFDAIDEYGTELRMVDGEPLGHGLIATREAKDRLEAAFADGLRRFDLSGEYAADGALGIVAWLRWKCRLSAGAAAERVTISRQLEQLPQTRKAFATGVLGYQHVAGIARTAEQVGAAEVRKAEAALLKTAGTMDPGQFTGFLRSYEHQVDAEKALAEANHAHQRRSLHVSEPSHGLVRVDGWLDEEGGAILNRALDRLMPPPARDDDRTSGQRRADALIELCQRPSNRSTDGAGPRPHLVIRASLDTLAGTPGAPGGQLEGAGSVHGETVRRVACDAALTRITGQGELEAEVSRATRTIPPATRRALAARDHGCVAEGCGRPPDWTDAHHIKHWVHGGETTMANLVLLCRRHHRMVHEEGWTMRQSTPGRWTLARPVAAHARSA
ncbi:MAG: HNH endonuclease [Candidatus Dormibacteraeota bacterium]|nr:HNH endonuclease [Candidatus Dormibacteraeota bacterium]